VTELEASDEAARAADAADPVPEAVRRVFHEAGLTPGASQRAITPLALVASGVGLRVDEVIRLNPQTAAGHLAKVCGRDLIDPGHDSEALAGFLYANAWGGWVLVNQGDPLVRRRFTVAHELGHYVLDFLPLLERSLDGGDPDLLEYGELIRRGDGSVDEAPPAGERLRFAEVPDPVGPGESAGEAAERERRANRFAAEVLMPEAVCRRLVADHALRCGGRYEVLARRLAGELLVSEWAMRHRLTELRLP
jgi:hypothetical protein